MKLSKAIEIMESELPNAMPNNPPRRLDALKLLIETGKWIVVCRREMHGVYPRLLPGETEE